jgi:hypothetical protein
VEPRHPLYAESLRLRITWRLESREREEAASALQLADRLGARRRKAQHQVLRARAAAAAGYPAAALTDLEALVSARRSGRVQQALVRAILHALRDIPPDSALAERRTRFEQQLRSR